VSIKALLLPFRCKSNGELLTLGYKFVSKLRVLLTETYGYCKLYGDRQWQKQSIASTGDIKRMDILIQQKPNNHSYIGSVAFYDPRSGDKVGLF